MGFMQNKSSVDALNVLTEDILIDFDRQTPTYAVFFDIVGCYDAVQHDILLNRLAEYYGLEGKIINIIRNLFDS